MGRNVRAAGGEAVIRRRGGRDVHLTELAPADRADIITEHLHAARRRSGAAANAAQMRFYFGLDPDASIDDIRAIVDTTRSSASSTQTGLTAETNRRATAEGSKGRRPCAAVGRRVRLRGRRAERAEVQPPDDRGREADPGTHHHRNRWSATFASPGRPLEANIEVTDYARPVRLGSTTRMPPRRSPEQ